jgi:hypothetical protein
MSKKTFMAAIIITTAFLVSLVAGMQVVNVVDANPLPYGQPNPPEITIESPTSSTYNQSDITINATVTGPTNIFGMAYHLNTVYYITDNEVGGYLTAQPSNPTQFSATLTGLSSGKHNVAVHAYASGAYYGVSNQIIPYEVDSTKTVTFTVNNGLQRNQTSNNSVSFPDGLIVYSPINTTYSSNLLLCNVSFTCGAGIQCNLNYSLDGIFQGYIVGAFNLSQLSEGQHRLSIGIEEGFSGLTHKFDIAYFSRVDSINFSIDTSAPSIKIIQPENTTYDCDTGVPLTVSIDEPTSWTGYSLDGQANITLTENVTLAGLNDGYHNITISANDTIGNMGKSNPIAFNVSTPTPSPTPTITASLSESASALNYGNKINFTVSVDGGVPPYTFTWYVDGQIAETSPSQYYSTNTMQVGSHHVYVQVIDANDNRATTLANSFEVLPALNPSSTGHSTPSPNIVSLWGNNIILYFVAVAVVVIVVLLVIFILKRK